MRDPAGVGGVRHELTARRLLARRHVEQTEIRLEAPVAAAGAIDPAALEKLDAALGAGTAADIVAVFLSDVPARLDRMRALARR